MARPPWGKRSRNRSPPKATEAVFPVMARVDLAGDHSSTTHDPLLNSHTAWRMPLKFHSYSQMKGTLK
jgi:hypothetical protein